MMSVAELGALFWHALSARNLKKESISSLIALAPVQPWFEGLNSRQHIAT